VTLYYFDTSALVKYYIPEVGSSWVTELVNASGDQDTWAHEMTMTELALVEVAAALARRCRIGDISIEERTRTLAQFSRDYPERYTVVEMQRGTIELAMDLTQRHPLRAYDAIHLATALQLDQALQAVSGTGLIFVSADGQLCRAAEAEGLKAENPNDYATEEEIRGIF
jgi:predicted nucleic acid-binding protein